MTNPRFGQIPDRAVNGALPFALPPRTADRRRIHHCSSCWRWPASYPIVASMWSRSSSGSDGPGFFGTETSKRNHCPRRSRPFTRRPTGRVLGDPTRLGRRPVHSWRNEPPGFAWSIDCFTDICRSHDRASSPSRRRRGQLRIRESPHPETTGRAEPAQQTAPGPPRPRQPFVLLDTSAR